MYTYSCVTTCVSCVFLACSTDCLPSLLFQLDSSALIPDLAFGANNEVAGIVTQLAIADALGRLKKDVSESAKLPLYFSKQ